MFHLPFFKKKKLSSYKIVCHKQPWSKNYSVTLGKLCEIYKNIFELVNLFNY